MKLFQSLVISLFLLVSLLVRSVSYGQAHVPVKKGYGIKTDKNCYCDSISLAKYEANGWSMSGVGHEILLNGKWCEDTFHFPPSNRLKRIGDTIIDNATYDSILCVVYVMSCKTCEPKIIAAYKILTHPHPYSFTMYEDTKTKKHYTGNDGWGIGYVSNGSMLLKYLTSDKVPFPKESIIIKEKELP